MNGKTAKFTPTVKKKSRNTRKKNTSKKQFKKNDSLKEGKKHFLPMMNIDFKKLPSKGLAYPKGAVIKYRPYSWGEVKQISQSKMEKKDQFEFIMDGVTVEGMDLNDITLGDAMFLAIYRKLSTVGGSKITVQYKCKKCGQVSKGIFKTLDVKADFMKAPKLPLRIDLGDKEYAFSPLTIGDYFAFREKKIADPSIDDDFGLISQQCTNVEFDEIYQRLYNISTEDEMEDIKYIDHYLSHGLKKIKNVCQNVLDYKESEEEDGEDIPIKCGHPSDIELDGGQALILPFREDGERKRNRIRFGDET